MIEVESIEGIDELTRVPSATDPGTVGVTESARVGA